VGCCTWALFLVNKSKEASTCRGGAGRIGKRETLRHRKKKNEKKNKKEEEENSGKSRLSQ
jgi:hypothetical protein